MLLPIQTVSQNIRLETCCVSGLSFLRYILSSSIFRRFFTYVIVLHCNTESRQALYNVPAAICKPK